MAYLVYVYSQTGPQPQIIHDEKLTEYVIGQKHLTVLFQFPLTDAQAKLSIDELVKLFPRPGGIHHEQNV